MKKTISFHALNFTFGGVRVSALALAVWLAVLSQPALCQPTVLGTFSYTDRFAPNDLPGFSSVVGDNIQFGVNFASLDPPGGASISVLGSQGSTTASLFFASSVTSIVPELLYVKFVPFDPSLTGAWNISIGDSTGTASATTNAIPIPQLLPFASDITVSDTTTAPTVSWSLPDLTGFDVDRIEFRAIDANSGAQIFRSFFALSTTAIQMPTGVLLAGHSYSYRVSLQDLEGTGSGRFVENRSNAFSSPVAAIPEPETYALLLAGLGVLGFAARRRKMKLAAA